MVVLRQMVVFFILMLVGMAARHAGLMRKEFLPQLSALIANVAGPCLILSGALQAEERLSLADAGFAFVVFGVLIAAMIAIGWLLPVLLRYDRQLRPTVNFAFWMTNIGYLGLPFAAAVYGPHTQIYVVLYLIPNNLLLYTYSIWLMKTNARTAEGAEGFDWKALANPGVAATALTVVLYFGGIDVPQVLAAPIEMLGSSTAPLAMMLVGAQLVDERALEVLRDVRLMAFTVLKMVVLPILLVLALKLFVADANLLAACLSVVAMPSGVLVSAYALLYDPPAAPVATKIVALTTFVAVVTIPLVAFVCGM